MLETPLAPYLLWAKTRQPAAIDLAGSNLVACTLDDLPGVRDAVDLSAPNDNGFAPLTSAIARHYGVTDDRVVTGHGCSGANFLAVAALVGAGDEVLIERPTYEPLLGAASFLGGEITRFDRRPEDGFGIDIDRVAAALTDRTRLIAITNLHNPSSAITDENDLRALAELAGASNARILVDEVYLDSAVPPGRSAAHLGPEFVCTNSLTKVYGLSGLRCGWILADPDLAERMWRLNDLFGVNQAHQAERLACLAFELLDRILGDTPAMLDRNRALFNAFVAGRTDVESMPAAQGIVAFPRWARGDTDRLAAHLREHYDTAVVPGRWFEMPDHFRVGLGVPTDVLEQGLNRIGAALDDLR